MQTTTRNRRLKVEWIAVAGMVLLLWISNQHFAFTSPLTRVVAGDTQGYFWIATDAPDLDEAKVPQHRAQRFVVPRTIGILARNIGLPEETGFYLAVLMVSGAIIYRWLHLLGWCGYAGTTAILLSGLFIFNPYTFRYCFAFPGIVGDLIFLWGLMHALESLWKRQGVFLVFWTMVMSLARQTVMACLPAIILGVFFLPSWRQLHSKRLVYAASLVFVTGVVFLSTRTLASPFSIPTSSLEFLKRGLLWYATRFEWDVFVVFALRFILTFWIPLLLFVGCFVCGPRLVRDQDEKIQPRILWLLIAGLCAQPILFGPEITAGGIQRLCVFSLPAALLILAPRLEQTPCVLTGSVGRTASIILMLWLSSLHHLYCFWGPQIEGAAYFVALHLASSMAILALVFVPGNQKLLPDS